MRAAVAALFVGSVAAVDFTLPICHVNDHHSHLTSATLTVTDTDISDSSVKLEYGGYARIATLMQSSACSDAAGALRVHAGDALTGTSLYSYFKGLADAAAMKHANFHAVALGNHEFDDGDASLANFISNFTDTDTVFLCSNCVPGESSPLQGLLLSYKKFTINGEDIGVIGVDVKDKTMLSSSPSPGTVLTDELPAVQAAVAALEDMGVNKIVLVSHIGIEADKALAQHLTGVDVIIGGDSHTMLGATNLADLFPHSGAYPTQALDAGEDTVCIFHAWEYAHLVGHASVVFDEVGKVTSCGGSPVALVSSQVTYAADGAPVPEPDNSDVLSQLRIKYPDVFVTTAEDAAVLSDISAYTAQTAALSARTLATFEEDMCYERRPGQGRSSITGCKKKALVHGGEACSLVAKAFLKGYAPADIAIQNGGGCRTDLPQGVFSYNDAYSMLPFTNTLWSLPMTGAQIKAVLEDSISGGESTSGSYPYAAGLSYDVDMTAAFGSRISNLMVNKKLAGSFVALSMMETYEVLTNDYIASGRDGYLTFGPLTAAGNYTNTYLLYTQSLIDYLATQTGSIPPIDATEYSTVSYTNGDGCTFSDANKHAIVDGACTCTATNLCTMNVKFESRAYVPHGKEGVADLYDFGMGAAEQVAYDFTQKYAYAVSEQGVINVVDYSDPLAPAVLIQYQVSTGGLTLTDIEVCPLQGKMFVGVVAAVSTDPGSVYIYNTVQRTAPATPELLLSITVGAMPDMIKPNHDCTKVAVAGEGEGQGGNPLVMASGSFSIIDVAAGTTNNMPLTGWTDEELIELGVHLPLPKKAMEYYDLHSAKFSGDLDFSQAYATYDSAMNLEPEYVAWSKDGETLFVNLQENSAVVKYVLTTGVRTIHSYGLKDWSEVKVDTVGDDAGCSDMAVMPGFKSLRNPDSIATFSVGGVNYLITANEGDDKEYGVLETKQKFKDLIDAPDAFDSDFAEFDVEASAAALATAHGLFSGSKMRVTIGSAAVDYSTPTAPVFKGAVGFGGRGITIYNADTMALVWDSGSLFEEAQCKSFPWAFNAIQDEEFAGTGGVLYANAGATLRGVLEELEDPDVDGCTDGGNGSPGACPMGQTVGERSLKDGAAPETVTVAHVCGKTLAVTSTEKSDTAFLFDLGTPAAPKLINVFHLSPASELKNPSIAYNDGTLGDIDPETILILTPEESPTGYAALLVGGAWSGTLSLYHLYDEDGNKCAAAAPTSGVTLVLTADGTVSEYDEGTISSIQTAFATKTGKSTDDVAVSVEGGSVIITVTIAVADAAAAATLAANLNSALADPAAATALLTSASVTVTAISQAAETAPPPPSAPPPDGGLSGGAIAGIIVGVIVGVILVVAVGAYCAMKNGASSKLDSKNNAAGA